MLSTKLWRSVDLRDNTSRYLSLSTLPCQQQLKRRFSRCLRASLLLPVLALGNLQALSQVRPGKKPPGKSTPPASATFVDITQLTRSEEHTSELQSQFH